MKQAPFSGALERASAFLRKLPESTRTMIATIVLGLAGAALAIAFLTLTNALYSLTFGRFASLSKPLFLAASLATVVVTSLAAGLLMYRLCPEAAGSGIPQLKAAYWKELGYVPLKPVLVKFAAGVLSIGGGTSLGREGPTVFMSGGAASWLSGFLGFSKRERRNPSLVGASSGLAAAFNTPLASITFVLEEIVGDISSRSIGRVLLSSVVGAFAVYALIGRQPAFQIPSLDQVSWIHYAIAPLVALAAGLLGVAFHRQAIALRARAKRRKRLPAWALPLVGGLITWAIGSTVFLLTGKLGVFSLGYHDLSSVLHNDYVWWIAGIMVVAKLVATIASYGLGGCGGIFSPLLFIGGFSGYFIGNLFDLWLPLTSSDLIVLSAVGMSACLGTVVKAPLSAMLIVFEMTHEFALVPALIIGMIVSMGVSRLAGKENFYDEILVQDGHELHKIRPPVDLTGWQDLPVSAIANRNPAIIRSLDEKSLSEAMGRYPYGAFPVVAEGAVSGVLTRLEVEKALVEGRQPELSEPIVCAPGQSIREVAGRLVSSSVDLAVIAEPVSGKVVGILTLHDILRAQAGACD